MIAKLLRNRGFWGVIVLILLGAITATAFSDATWAFGSGHVFFSVIFSLVPGLLWLYFFYLQDRYEREPHHFLLGIFILSAALSYAVAYPIEQMYEASHGVLAGMANNLLAQVLVFGALQQLIIFMVVRYTVFFSDEFNEPADGVIYCIAAGLGQAAAYNIVYLNGLEQVAVGVVSIRIIEYYLTMAVISGIMGYFMGQAKFKQGKGERSLIIGYLTAVLLNGLYDFFSGRLQGLEHDIWTSLLFTVGFVIVLYVFMFGLLTRSVEQSQFKQTAS